MQFHLQRVPSQNVAYKKSKAKSISLNKEISNIYTTGEKAERWYKVKVTSSKKKRRLEFGKIQFQEDINLRFIKQEARKYLKQLR